MQYYFFFKCHAQYFATSFILVIYSEHAIAIPKLGTDGNQDTIFHSNECSICSEVVFARSSLSFARLLTRSLMARSN